MNFTTDQTGTGLTMLLKNRGSVDSDYFTSKNKDEGNKLGQRERRGKSRV